MSEEILEVEMSKDELEQLIMDLPRLEQIRIETTKVK